MIDEIRKSINATLYERVVSPFWGTFISSWCICNWQIPYVTFFVQEKTLSVNKVEFIVNNYTNYYHLIIYPLISTTILLTLFPFVSNGAFWLSLQFRKWRVEQKQKSEKTIPISVEKAAELRNQIEKQEENFNLLMQDKDDEIKILKETIEKLKEKKSEENAKNNVYLPNTISLLQDFPKQKSIEDEYNDFTKMGFIYDAFSSVIRGIRDSRFLPNQLTDDKFSKTQIEQILNYFESNKIISNSTKSSIYFLTEKGLEFVRLDTLKKNPPKQ